MVQAYCMKEKKKVTVKNPTYSLNKRNSGMVRGTCSSCGGKVAKILAVADLPPDLQAKRAKRIGGNKSSSESLD